MRNTLLILLTCIGITSGATSCSIELPQAGRDPSPVPGDLARVGTLDLDARYSEVDVHDGSGQDGATKPERVTRGLIALYTFEEGSGSTVLDRSDTTPLLPLEIDASSGVEWVGPRNGVRFVSAGVAASTEAASKLHLLTQQTEELSLEVWCAPHDIEQGGPARIVSWSDDQYLRNVTLGQSGSELNLRVRSGANLNGYPELYVSGVKAVLSHYVMAYDGETLVVYMDGEEVAREARPGNLSLFDSSYRLLFGNEGVEPRPWLGVLYRVAIFNQALSPEEVKTNFMAGSYP